MLLYGAGCITEDRIELDWRESWSGSVLVEMLPTTSKGMSRERELDVARGDGEDRSVPTWSILVKRSSYTEVGRMRPELDKSFREGLMRHEGVSSFRGVENTSKEADDLAAFEVTSSTVRARERAAFEGGKSLLSSLEACDRTAEEPVVGGVEDGRRIRYATSVREEALEDACAGSGFITEIPVELGDSGEAIIGAGVVRGFE
jgi:hypothetical protein